MLFDTIHVGALFTHKVCIVTTLAAVASMGCQTHSSLNSTHNEQQTVHQNVNYKVNKNVHHTSLSTDSQVQNQTSSYGAAHKNSTIQQKVITDNANPRGVEKEIRLKAQHIQTYLAQHQFAKLIPFIHPSSGVRFSMYAYVDPKTDKVFSRQQYKRYLTQSRISFTWGQKDGTGELYVTPLPDYLTDWVKAKDFNNVAATYNHFKGSGNSLNNLKDIYPDAEYVEFYHSGQNPDYQGMDWRALRLVFKPYLGDYYLVAIITDQWTI